MSSQVPPAVPSEVVMVVQEPGTPRLLRAINDRAVLDLLLTHGAQSRPTLGDLTGLSKPTMSQILSRLQEAGLVRPSGSSPGRPGPNAALYEVNPQAAYVAGLDVTPRRIRAGVADITGRTIGVYELPTPGRDAARHGRAGRQGGRRRCRRGACRAGRSSTA